MTHAKHTPDTGNPHTQLLVEVQELLRNADYGDGAAQVLTCDLEAVEEAWKMARTMCNVDAQLLAVLKDTRGELQTLFNEDYDYSRIDTAIAAAEKLAMAANPTTITVHVEGGLVQDVTGIPAGYELRVEDHDGDDISHPAWDAEKECFVTIYDGGVNA
jgi:hypothetical protein